MSRFSVIAPSSRGEINPSDIAVLEKRGHSVSIYPQCALTHHQSAGSAEERAAAVMDVFKDKQVDAIIAARGGNRAMHTLPYLDFDALKDNAKPLIAFSDGTALLNAVYAQTGVTGFHGPTVSRLAKCSDAEIDQMLACIEGRENHVDLTSANIISGGSTEAPMVGGNLSVFTALIGTPYMPDCTGKIVYLEDIGDQLSRYDRMLAQLRLAGVFDRAAAIIFGVMHAEGDSSVTPFGFSLSDILYEHTKHLKKPVIYDAPFGHKGPLWTFPVGGHAHIDAGSRVLTIEASDD